MRYFVHLSYYGKNYRGWQRQPKVHSVQEVLEDRLSKMIGSKITCFGCGRTDAEVHASQYIMHINVEREFDYDPVFRLNKMLPNDIAIYSVVPVESHRHARYDAIQRGYEYYIHGYKNPILHQTSSLYPFQQLDLQAIQAALQLLPEHTDYYNFCKSPESYNHTMCCISSAVLCGFDQNRRLKISISADRFLRGMIRKLVFSLMEIGYGRLSIGEFQHYLKVPDDQLILRSAYPQGLYLSRVVYPYIDFPSRPFLTTGS